MSLPFNNHKRDALKRIALWGATAASVAVLAACSPSAKAPKFNGIDVTGADYAKDFPLPDQDGKTRSIKDFAGKVVVVFFGYTQCPDVCPTTMSELAEVKRSLGADGERLQGVFITVDPDQATPQLLATYTDFFDKRIIGLTGSPALIQAAARNFKVRYEKVIKENQDPRNYAVDHSAGLYLLGPEGAFIKKFAYATPADSMASEIRQLLHTH